MTARRIRWLTVAALVAVALVLTAEPAIAQCQLCRESLRTGGKEGFVRGLFWSIILIGGMPFAIVGAIGFGIMRARRKIVQGGPVDEPPTV